MVSQTATQNFQSLLSFLLCVTKLLDVAVFLLYTPAAIQQRPQRPQRPKRPMIQRKESRTTAVRSPILLESSLMLACSQFKKSMLMKATAHKRKAKLFSNGCFFQDCHCTIPFTFFKGIIWGGSIKFWSVAVLYAFVDTCCFENEGRSWWAAGIISKDGNTCIAWASRAGIIEIEQIRIRIPWHKGELDSWI